MMGFGLVVLMIIVVTGLYLTGREPGKRFIVPDSALDTLRERYARGDISREEYDEMRQEIS